MRVTVDLPPGLHHRLKRLAAARGQSFSALTTELLIVSLESQDEPDNVTINPLTGMPQIDFGRNFSQVEIDTCLED
ncbi:MAG: hypothetical protein LBK42_12340 [Propionibacteriaceae bacterium]|jgi:plasmid stability protein|nr:hypothetical protein [Propionibacteriaceae bacterium]